MIAEEQLPNQDPSADNLERLELEPFGWYSHPRIPYKIHYNLNCPESDSGEKGPPGEFMVTPDLNADGSGGESLSIFVSESVPEEFKEVVFFHELREAELTFADGLDEPQAHAQAVVETEEYAKKFLPADQFAKFLEWNLEVNLK